MPTTIEKVESFVAGLDDDERAELAALGPTPSRDDLSPGLRRKLQATADGLTNEDRAAMLAAVEAEQADGTGDDVEGFGVVRDHRSGVVRDHRTPPRDHRGTPIGPGYFDVLENEAKKAVNAIVSLF